MSDEPFALTIPAPPATQADYESICAAVMETGRGRWFLAEFARRNRHADTEVLLAALERIEALVRREPAAESLAPSGSGPETIKPDGGEAGQGALPQNLSDRLESAASTLRNGTERLQDVAWRLRELQYDDKFCDEIDAGTRDIVAACVAIERVAAASRSAAAATPQDSDPVPAAAPGAPQAAALALDEFASTAAQPPDAFTIAWGVGFGLDDGGGPPEHDVDAAPQSPPENAWDQSAIIRAFETEAAPAMSAWQLPEESESAPAEADSEPATPKADSAVTEPVTAGLAIEPEAVESLADEPQAVAPQVAEPQAAEPQVAMPAPETPAAQDRAQEKIRHALGQATNPEPPSSGGWLSSLLSRKARGETDEDEGEREPAREAAAVQKTATPSAATAPQAMVTPASTPIVSAPSASAPVTSAPPATAEPEAAMPPPAVTAPQAVAMPPSMPAAIAEPAIATASLPWPEMPVQPIAFEEAPPEPALAAPMPPAPPVEAAPPPVAWAPVTALQAAVVQAIAAATAPPKPEWPPRDFEPLFAETTRAIVPPPLMFLDEPLTETPATDKIETLPASPVAIEPPQPAATVQPEMPAAAPVQAPPIPGPTRVIAEANVVELEAEDDPAGFLLEPLPAALTAGLLKPQAAKPQIFGPEPRPAPRDPLAPIRAMSDEERIALSS